MVLARIPKVAAAPKPQQALKTSQSGRPQPTSFVSAVSSEVWLILASIKPEHIAEMTYEDCFSTKVTGHTHTSQALFVVLKPGVGYDASVGSFVIADEDSIIHRTRRTTQAAAPAAPVPAYRLRVLASSTPSPVTRSTARRSLIPASRTDHRRRRRPERCCSSSCPRSVDALHHQAGLRGSARRGQDLARRHGPDHADHESDKRSGVAYSSAARWRTHAAPSRSGA